MTRQPEIVAGIKQAVQRGESMEKAKQTFVQAGYNQQDVEDSAKAMEGVISKIPEIPSLTKKGPAPSPPGTIPAPETKPKKAKKWMIILIILLAILLITLGVSFFFREQILQLFG